MTQSWTEDSELLVNMRRALAPFAAGVRTALSDSGYSRNALSTRECLGFDSLRRPLPRSTNQLDADEIAFMAFWEGRPRWKSILEQAEMPKQMKDLSVTTDMPAYAVAKVCRMLRLYGMIQRSKMKGDYPLWALTLTGVKAKERLNHLSSMTAQA